jgi:hypothetical protein
MEECYGCSQPSCYNELPVYVQVSEYTHPCGTLVVMCFFFFFFAVQCFMNSVIQCLSNTRPLLEYLLGDCHLSDINTTVSSMKGALIKGTVYSQLSPDSMVSFYVACSVLNFFPKICNCRTFFGFLPVPDKMWQLGSWYLTGIHIFIHLVLIKETAYQKLGCFCHRVIVWNLLPIPSDVDLM